MMGVSGAIAAPLAAGNYTIGGAGGNFATFSAAVARINADGIAGNVNFAVRPGTYSEAITIHHIQGVGQVVFASESGDSTSVTLVNSFPSDTVPLRLDGAQGISFTGIRFFAGDTLKPGVVSMIHGCASIEFRHCLFEGVIMADRITGQLVDGSESDSAIGFTDNQFRTASSGIKIVGKTVRPRQIRVSRNRFDGIRDLAINLQHLDAPLAVGNMLAIISGAETFTGISLYQCTGALLVDGNRMNIRAQDGIAVSIWMCDGTAQARGMVSNNMIVFDVTSQAAKKQWGLLLYRSTYQNFHHNSIRQTSALKDPLANFSAVHLDAVAPTHVAILNNIFSVNSGQPLSLTSQIDTTIHSDNNDLFSTSGNIGVFNGTFYATLTQWRNGVKLDQHSRAVDPGFASAADLHLRGDAVHGLGADIGGNPRLDIDGQTRNPRHPDIGADELRSYREKPAYVAFPATRADWRVSICGFGCDTLRYWLTGGDTVVGDLSYHRIYEMKDLLKFSLAKARYVGAIREDSVRRVFILRAGMTRELPLYDFDAVAGDTVRVGGMADTNLYPVVVESTDSVLIDGAYRRRINLAGGESWIDGVGSTGSVIFPGVTRYITDYAPALLCFRQEDRPLYGTSCATPNLGLPWGAGADPATAGISVTGAGGAVRVIIPDGSEYTLDLYDLSGKAIGRMYGIGSGRLPYERSLAAGVYLYRLTLTSGDAVDGKLMME